MAPDKWESHARDFLIGNADRYNGLVPEDVLKLRQVLVDADSAGMPVVLTVLSLPGCRWRQNNGDRLDLRIWTDTAYWSQAAAFWRDLVIELRDIRTIVGVNVMNEPTPFKIPGTNADSAATMLNGLYAAVVKSIREVNATIPIILGGDQWASAAGLPAVTPIDDSNVLYSVHMYEPFTYTNRGANSGRFCYPGFIVEDGDTVKIGLDYLKSILAPIHDWQRTHEVPANRIVVEEFGCHRTSCGAADYLADVISICDESDWHWAFYSFREDTWDGMDYELGTRPPSWEYWKALERGDTVALPRVENAVWDVLRHALRRDR
jgi:hypothetical protein